MILLLWLIALSRVLAQVPQTPTNVAVNARLAAPTITSLSVSTGAVGTAVTITGTNFGQIQGVSTVTFNGTAATIITWAATSLATTVPSGATTGNVVVTVASQASNGSAFTVTGGAAVNPMSATRQPAGDTSAPQAVWAVAGVEGGIPTTRTQCVVAACNTVAGGSVTSATINAALAAAPSGTYVLVPVGNWTLTSGIVFSQSNITLRGANADTSRLVVTGTNSGCSLFYNEAVRMCAGSGHLGCTSGCGGGPGPDHTATWTPVGASGSWVASQGITQLTFSSTTSLIAGSTVVLDQIDDSVDGYPAAGDMYVCHSTGGGAQPCSYEGGGSWYRLETDRSQNEVHKVTNVSGTTVTISPGIYAPNFRQVKTPGAWWGDSAIVMHDSGIEDLTIDWTAAGSAVGVLIENCTNCWLKGNRLIYNASAANFVMGIDSIQTLHNTYHGNYFYGPKLPEAVTNYSYTIMNGSLNLFENNILDNNITPLAAGDPESGNVHAYNYIVNSAGFAALGPQEHGIAQMYTLYESNDWGNFIAETIHGTKMHQTLFRNAFSGNQNQPGAGCAEACSGIVIEIYARFYNLVGNVFSSPSEWSVYEDSVSTAQFLATRSANIYLLGWRGTHGAPSPGFCTVCPSDYSGGNDDHVTRTLFRWGNWDAVTAGANKNVSNDQTGARWNSGEVPSAITSYANALPASQTLPASLYLSAKPAWFGTRPFPMIGPDVVNPSPIANTGAHVYKIPSRYRYENGTLDAVYGSSSPRIRSNVTCGVASCPTP